MKKSIFVLTTFLLAFSIYIISPANLVLADNSQEDPNFELIQDDQIPSDAHISELYKDETPEEVEERLRQEEEDRMNPLSFQGGDEDKDEEKEEGSRTH